MKTLLCAALLLAASPVLAFGQTPAPAPPTAGLTVTVNGQTYTGTATLTLVAPPPPNLGAPLYSGAYTGTDVVQTPAAPFSAATPVNTVVREAILSHARISRVTDRKTGGGLCGTNNQWNATPSGGSYDVITNTTSSLLVVQCSGGIAYIVGFNPATLATFPASPAPFAAGAACIGGVAPSRVDPTVIYCRPAQGQATPIGVANGTAVYKITFPFSAAGNLCGLGVGNCPDVSAPQWTKFIDFNTCPQFQTAKQQWTSLLAVGANDSNLAVAISYTGNQGTARYLYNYLPGAGCSTFDTQGNGTNSIWYSASGVPSIIPVAAVWFIHDITTNGPWVTISPTALPTPCVGAACGTGDGPAVWQANTNNLLMFGAIANASGHENLSKSFFFNNNNPTFIMHPLSNAAAASTIGQTSCFPCQDTHFNADVNSDGNPLLGTTGGNTIAAWTTPYKSEVYGLATDGSGKVWRFAKTYSSGNPVGAASPTNFWAQYGTGAPSQDRKLFFFTSDMLGLLGKTAAGVNQWDIFAVDLTGQ